MNSIILTALENKCPLHSFRILDFRMTKGTKHKIENITLNHIPLYFTGTFYMQCDTFLFSNCSYFFVLSFMYLHSIYITMNVTNNEIIAVTNRHNSIVYLLKKKFLLGISDSVMVCLSCKSKIFFLWWYWWTKSISVIGVVSNLESNLDTFKEKGKVFSQVVLFIKSGSFKESVKLSRLSR